MKILLFVAMMAMTTGFSATDALASRACYGRADLDLQYGVNKDIGFLNCGESVSNTAVNGDAQCRDKCKIRAENYSNTGYNDAFVVAIRSTKKQLCGTQTIRVHGRAGDSGDTSDSNNFGLAGTGTLHPSIAMTPPTCPAVPPGQPVFSLNGPVTAYNLPSTCIKEVPATFVCPTGWHSKDAAGWPGKCAILNSTAAAGRNAATAINGSSSWGITPHVEWGFVWQNNLYQLTNGSWSCATGYTLAGTVCRQTTSSIPGIAPAAAWCQAAP